MYRERYWTATSFEAVARLKQVAQEHGHTLPQFALAWVLNNETITSAVGGATSVEQLQANLKVTEVKLSEEEIKACDSVWRQIRPRRGSYTDYLIT